MNLKLVRTTRTPYSEEISIYDVDLKDADDQPVKLGKMDIHYLDDQIVGTLLVWQEYALGYSRTHSPGFEESLEDIIDAILTEVSEPVGVSATYAVEVYYPPMSGAAPGPGFVSNYPDDDADEEEGEGESTSESKDTSEFDEGELEETEDTDGQDDERGDDDFANRLRQRP